MEILNIIKLVVMILWKTLKKEKKVYFQKSFNDMNSVNIFCTCIMKNQGKQSLYIIDDFLFVKQIIVKSSFLVSQPTRR